MVVRALRSELLRLLLDIVGLLLRSLANAGLSLVLTHTIYRIKLWHLNLFFLTEPAACLLAHLSGLQAEQVAFLSEVLQFPCSRVRWSLHPAHIALLGGLWHAHCPHFLRQPYCQCSRTSTGWVVLGEGGAGWVAGWVAGWLGLYLLQSA